MKVQNKFSTDIPTKANKILHFILIALLLILIRIWHLSVIQYDKKLAESQRPQRKTIIEPAIRATIRDRFNIPFAVNKMSYQAAIIYSQIHEIPYVKWKKDENGKSKKIYVRKEYIQKLSQLLSRELGLEAQRIEDSIYSKATFYFQIPFIIKEDLSEKEYYRLKLLAKDWPGLLVRHFPRRHYPLERVAADVIGYMGAINKHEYEKIVHEIHTLEQFIHDIENGDGSEDIGEILDVHHAKKRLNELEAKAYSIHDFVGKTGIEEIFEKELRGFYGKKSFTIDSKGNFLKELPGTRPPLPGKRILLTLSAELQEYAEQLLIQNETLRIVRKTSLGGVKQTVMAQKSPWIKGGAIVAMDPNTGEILALASYPRFDPNDFIIKGSKERQKEKNRAINQWFENEKYIAQLWNQQQPLKRERYDKQNNIFYDEEILLTWEAYLNFILPSESKIFQTLKKIHSISRAIDIQHEVKKLLDLFPEHHLYTLFNYLYVDEGHEPYGKIVRELDKEKRHEKILEEIKKKLDPYFNQLPHNYDKVLLIDLCRLAVNHECFSPKLIQTIGHLTLGEYRKQMGALITLKELVRENLKNIYHETDFKLWRDKEEKNFLKIKRQEEVASGSYPKPYIDYLDKKENSLFQEFWNNSFWNCLYTFLTGQKNPSDLLVSSENLIPYLNFFSQWHQEIKKGIFDGEKWKDSYDTLQRAIEGIDYELAIDYLKTMRSYEELNHPLLGRYRYLRQKNKPLGKHLAAAFYPIHGLGYARSHAYRQSAIQGSLFKLVTTYEALIQRFKKMGCKILSPKDLNPLIIIDEVFQQKGIQYVGYTEDGKPIPQLYKGGRVPRSLAHKKIGKIDLVRALEMSSNPYFSLLAGECLEHPDDLSHAARLFAFGSKTGIDLTGEICGKVPEDLSKNRTGLYAMAIGQHSLVVTPLQTAVMLAAIANGGKILKPKLVKLSAGSHLSNNDIGIDYSSSTASSYSNNGSFIKEFPTEIKKEIFMPEIVRHIILKGLKAVTLRSHQENIQSLTHLYRKHPEAIQQFTELKDQLLGKTSTAESVENIDLDLKEGTNIYTHVWFGSISFLNQAEKNKSVLLFKDEFGQPELIVVVYLRYGGYGKEAAPLAAQMVKKWREIKAKYSQ